MKKILIGTDHKFWVINNGSRQRIASLVKFFVEQGLDVHVCYAGILDDEDRKSAHSKFKSIKIYSSDLEYPLGNSKLKIAYYKIRNYLIDCIEDYRYGKADIADKIDITEIINTNNSLSHFFSASNRIYFQKICKLIRPQIILIEYLRQAYLVAGIDNLLRYKPIKMIDTHDVMFKRCEQFKAMGETHWIDINENDEKAVLDLFDVVIAIQNNEAETFRTILKQKNVVTAGYVTEIYKPGTTDSNCLKLSYIASENDPNQHAIVDFIDKVWPRLKEKYNKSISLHIAGTICNRLVNVNLENGIILEGLIPDTNLFYANTDIVINPVTFGGGLKIKNVEALCYSKPLVTTTVGAEGLETGVNEAFYVCNSEENEFLTLCRLIEDPLLRKSISEKAYAFAQANFIPEVAYKELLSVITKMTVPA